MLIDFVYHSALVVRVKKKKKDPGVEPHSQNSPTKAVNIYQSRQQLPIIISLLLQFVFNLNPPLRRSTPAWLPETWQAGPRGRTPSVPKPRGALGVLLLVYPKPYTRKLKLETRLPRPGGGAAAGNLLRLLCYSQA